LIGWLGLTEGLAQAAVSGLRGKLNVGGASLGWFSRIQLQDVTLKDTEGNLVASVPRVESSKTLLGLVWDRSDLGEFHVQAPTLHLTVEESSTNLERVLADYLQPGEQKAGATPSVTIRVTDAKVHVEDSVAHRKATLDQGTVVVNLPREGAPTARASVQVQDEKPGRLAVEADLAGKGTAKLTLESFPLDLLNAGLRRVQQKTTLSGNVSGKAAVTWATEAHQLSLTVSGDLQGQKLMVNDPALQGDSVRLESLALPLDVSLIGSRLTIRQADLRCDLGTVTARGTVDTSEPLDRLLNRPGLTLDTDLDLARLAQMLPHVLTLREGTRVTEGKLVLKLASEAAEPATLWKGEVRTSALRAQREGQILRWDEPLTVTFTSRVRAGELPTFDEFVCRSDFLTASASGSAQSIQLRADLSLDRLVQRLSDFVDLGGVTLAGNGKLLVDASRTPVGDMQTKASLEVTQFVYADRGGRSVNEPVLKVSLDGKGQFASGKPLRVDSGTLRVNAGSDTLSLDLRSTLPDLAQVDRALVDVNLQGDLARWQARAGRLVALPRDLQIGGVGTVAGQVSYNPNVVRVERLAVDLERALFRGYGLVLDEPKLIASAGMVVATMKGEIEAEKVLLSCATAGVNAPRLILEPTAAGYRVETAGSLQADLARVQRVLRLQSDPRGNDSWAGVARGTFRCTAEGNQTQFGSDLDVQNFRYGPPLAPVWAEPQIKLTATGMVDPAVETVRLDTLRLGREALTLDARGTLSRWSTARDVAVTGTLSYDLARLTPQFRDFLGSGFQATGQGQRSFAIHGPLASLRGLTANGSLGWQSVRAYGLDVGPGDLKLNLANGVLTANPVEASFAGGAGKVRIQPTVQVDPAPQVATLANGRIIDRAQMTPQSTAQALGYALPPIANSANAEGEFSFVLEENRIPLAAPTQTSLRGRLEIHRAVVSAGPLATEIARLLRANQTSVTLASENVVPVRIEQGRVYHENLTLTVNQFTLKTRGSVGFDGTLSLVAEVPAPAGLLNSNPKVAQALAGRMIPVPIGGTLKQPRLDPVAFQQAVARMAAEVVQDTIRETGRDLINRELNKILPGDDKGKKPLPGLEKLLPGFPRR
jgi:hypothetical protein